MSTDYITICEIASLKSGQINLASGTDCSFWVAQRKHSICPTFATILTSELVPVIRSSLEQMFADDCSAKSVSRTSMHTCKHCCIDTSTNSCSRHTMRFLYNILDELRQMRYCACTRGAQESSAMCSNLHVPFKRSEKSRT